jgi:hypothetical protein
MIVGGQQSGVPRIAILAKVENPVFIGTGIQLLQYLVLSPCLPAEALSRRRVGED